MLFPVILSTVLGIEGTNYTQHSVSSNNILKSVSIAPLYLYSNVLNFVSTRWFGSGLTFNGTATPQTREIYGFPVYHYWISVFCSQRITNSRVNHVSVFGVIGNRGEFYTTIGC